MPGWLISGWEFCSFVIAPEEWERYKRADFDQPCVNVAPVILYPMTDREGTVNVGTRVSYIQHPENVVGRQLSYPKKICFKGPDTGASRFYVFQQGDFSL